MSVVITTKFVAATDKRSPRIKVQLFIRSMLIDSVSIAHDDDADNSPIMHFDAMATVATRRKFKPENFRMSSIDVKARYWSMAERSST